MDQAKYEIQGLGSPFLTYYKEVPKVQEFVMDTLETSGRT